VIRCLLWWCQERRASYLLSPSVRRSVEPRPIWLLRPHLAHPGTNSARPQGRWLLPASGWSGIYKLYQLYSLSRTILHPKVYWKYFPNGSMPSVPWRCWLVGRKGIWPLKTEWWVAGVVFCPEQGTDLHMAQLIPLVSITSVKSRLVLPFCYQLTQVVTEKGPLNMYLCVGSPLA